MTNWSDAIMWFCMGALFMAVVCVLEDMSEHSWKYKKYDCED